MPGPRIGIVDYGMGNLRSMANALEEVGARPEMVADHAALDSYDKLVLPGVGAFGRAMANLSAHSMDAALTEYAHSGRQVLGVCLGMQLMAESSEESESVAGLGWIPGRVIAFHPKEGVKVPHMGWNSLRIVRDHPMVRGIENGSDAYFVHSYHFVCADERNVVANSEHGVPFTAILARDNLVGMQFHPEKSQSIGLTLIGNFVRD